MSTIVWLASYPKSGNTWFRAFLANLLSDRDEPVDINALQTGGIASARPLFDEYAGVDAADLTMDEVDRLRPAVYRKWAAGHDLSGYHKIHDAYVSVGSGEPLVPADVTRAALYFVRNPLDVAVSYAHHAGTDVDRVIRWMGDRDHCFCGAPGRLQGQLRQRLLTWSDHVITWVDHGDFPVHAVRYEDMSERPLEVFAEAAEFAGVAHDVESVERALGHAAFDTLVGQEREHGFREKSPAAPSFFRKGEVGSWRDQLDAPQVRRLIDDHRVVMERLGYLDESGEPRF